MNTKTVNLLIIFLGMIVLLVVAGCVVISYQGKDVPAALVGFGGTALGALAGLLTRPPADAPQVAAELANQAAPDFGPLQAEVAKLSAALTPTDGGV